ncbi:hypothetical protein KAR91_14845 [Candidatus Pacearchaeota archaeon]|nr:hypothetical protein [Candidatus Pacearchaeota archaeon]
MIDIFFNDTHDLTLEGQDLKFADQSNIVKQRLTIRLQFLLAEWFLDNSVGVPYTQTIFAAGTPLTDVYTIIRRIIIDTDDVNTLSSLDLTPDADARSLRIDFEVTTDNGSVSDSIIVQV